MIARPSWEKPLRQRLRQRLRRWRQRRFIPRWLRDQVGTIVLLFTLQCLMAYAGEDTLGIGGGSTGIASVSGLIGVLLAISLRSRWQSHGWLLDWTPATPASAWRLRTREHLPAIVTTVVITLLFSSLAAGFHDETTVMTGLAAAGLSMGCGFLLAGGRISSGLLFASVILIFFYTVISGWLGSGEREVISRIAKGTGLAWLPILPWSLATHGTPAPALHLGIVGVALVISLREWRSAWSLRTTRAPEIADHGDPASDEQADEPIAVEDVTPEATNEEQRQNIRQHVAFAWFGMAGYMPDGPMPRFERILWRWFSPRERFLSCLGSQQSFTWFPRTRVTAGTLALMLVLIWLIPWLEQLIPFGDDAFWLFAAFLILASLALLTGWPGRDSSFQSWLDNMQTVDLGQFPALAVLPVTPGEWLRAAAKEWIVRSVWIASLWSVAILLGYKTIVPQGPLSGLVAVALLPWLFLAAWFPLSVLHRLVNAVAGAAFRIHGLGWVLTAVISGVLGLATTGIAIVGIAAGKFIMALAALSIATLLGAFSLWLTLRRCRGMRLDIKPKPLP